MSEHEIQTEILELIRLRGGLPLRVNSGNVSHYVKGAPKGTADIIACYHGRFLAIEVKDTNGKLSQAQVKFSVAVIHAGGLYIVARSAEEMNEKLDVVDSVRDFRIV
jgi:Holliday junction resolvase